MRMEVKDEWEGEGQGVGLVVGTGCNRYVNMMCLMACTPHADYNAQPDARNFPLPSKAMQITGQLLGDLRDTTAERSKASHNRMTPTGLVVAVEKRE